MDHGWSISSREQDIGIIVSAKDIEIIVPATVIPYACGRAVRRIHLLMGAVSRIYHHKSGVSGTEVFL